MSNTCLCLLARRGKAKACVQQELKGVKLDTNAYTCLCLLTCRGKAKAYVQQEIKRVKLDTNAYTCLCLLACRGKAKAYVQQELKGVKHRYECLYMFMLAHLQRQSESICPTGIKRC